MLGRVKDIPNRENHLSEVRVKKRFWLRPCSVPGRGLDAGVGLKDRIWPRSAGKQSLEGLTAEHLRIRLTAEHLRIPDLKGFKTLLEMILSSLGNTGLRKPFR